MNIFLSSGFSVLIKLKAFQLHEIYYFSLSLSKGFFTYKSSGVLNSRKLMIKMCVSFLMYRHDIMKPATDDMSRP